MDDEPDTLVRPAPTADASNFEIAFFLRLAALQIEIALSETATPVAELAAILGRLGGSRGSFAASSELQFHGRLAQQLLAVRDALATRADVIDVHGSGGVTTTIPHAGHALRRRAVAARAPLNVGASERTATARQLVATAARDRADETTTPTERA
jgi:hypothetical protein